MHRPWFVLPVIVAAQAAGTSLWFAGNAVLAGREGLSTTGLTNSVQLGFIAGTLTFALLSLADKVKTSGLFLTCCLLGAGANAAIPFFLDQPMGVLLLRFATGLFLAGIYPVGMKIAAEWFPNGLGKAMGWLVGALVLGTAFPHAIRSWLITTEPAQLLWLISGLAAIGGFMLFFSLPSKISQTAGKLQIQPGVIKLIWQEKPFRKATYGYLGHMWELYSFWAYVPFLINLYLQNGGRVFNPYLISFITISAGAAGCIGGGYLSKFWGSSRVSRIALLSSCICCLIAPLILHGSFPMLLLFLTFWGLVAAADSPQLSTLAAQTAPPSLKGTALTLLTSAGFSLTVLSLFIMQHLTSRLANPVYALFFLAPGPLLGALALWPVKSKQHS